MARFDKDAALGRFPFGQLRRKEILECANQTQCLNRDFLPVTSATVKLLNQPYQGDIDANPTHIKRSANSSG
jgi:hypothetical protein